MATATVYTSETVDGLLAEKADLAGGILPDAQAPAIAMKKDTWVIDLSDHGGVGDNTTPNDAAFISALAAINPTWGGKIVLRSGAYVISGSTAITLAVAGTIIEGSGAENTRIVIGSGYTAGSAVMITANNCQVRDLSIAGSNSTTTSNPVTDAIYIYGARRAKVINCHFWYINAWAIEAIAGTTSTSNPDGTMLNDLVIRQCAGGIHFQGNNTASGYAVNSFMTDIMIKEGGVTTGTSANLDGVLIEDSWDILTKGLFTWLSAGSGSALHIKGNCAMQTIQVIDALGPSAGPNILIETGTNGSPQNIQIKGGVIQQGLIGARITGAASHVYLEGLRFINNVTHAISVEGTGDPINLKNLFISASGTGASGTNYDINWSGTALGFVEDVRYISPIVATGTAGVQASVNITAGQNVPFMNNRFEGSGSSSSNWFTALPAAASHISSGTLEFLTNVNFNWSGPGRVSLRPPARGNNVLATNIPVGGAPGTNDDFRMTGDGTMSYGLGGSNTRDSTWGRVGVAEMGSSDSDIAVMLAGKTFKIKEGTNAKMGTATLNGTTAVTITTSAVTANSRIFPAIQTGSGTVGSPYVSARTPGTSFQVKSTAAGDTSTIAWVILEPA